MRRTAALVGMTLAMALVVLPAVAQIVPPGGAPLLPPPPPPPPPPRIYVPVVPQLDVLPSAPHGRRSKRRSFGDRITRCLEQGAAAGLGPNARARYSRECANR